MRGRWTMSVPMFRGYGKGFIIFPLLSASSLD